VLKVLTLTIQFELLWEKLHILSGNIGLTWSTSSRQVLVIQAPKSRLSFFDIFDLSRFFSAGNL